jgi:hypothetical protein
MGSELLNLSFISEGEYHKNFRFPFKRLTKFII